MSLILKGIDLPEKNKSLYIRIFNGKIEIVHMLDAYEVEHTNAEAIQVPKDHGRIGDLDKLQNAIKADIMGGLNYKFFIRNAPVILEVEGEK